MSVLLFAVCLVVPDNHYSAVISPNVTQFLITGLSFGTSYHAYLEAVFSNIIPESNSNILRSWILISRTLGIGPDNRMFLLLFMFSNKKLWLR